MGATANNLLVLSPDRPPDRPDHKLVRGYGRRRFDISRYRASGDIADTHHEPGAPVAGPLVVEHDIEGGFVVSDILGAVYGAGGSVAEARADYEAALGRHLAFLQANQGRLHPTLEKQLALLRRLFPGR